MSVEDIHTLLAAGFIKPVRLTKHMTVYELTTEGRLFARYLILGLGQ